MIEPRNRDFEVVGAFNPGVAAFMGKTVLLVRVAERVKADARFAYVPIVENGKIKTLKIDRSDGDYDFSDPRLIVGKGGKLLTSMSRLVVAESADGVNFEIFPERGIFPETEYEEYGVEDPRVTEIDGTYYITYTAVSGKGVCVALAVTEDFRAFEKKGVVLCPDNKDAAIFPEKIGGKFYMLHRPSRSEFARPEMWIAESDNLTQWGNHRRVLATREGDWDGVRLGSSSTPIKTEGGWLVLYHGADRNDRYCLGAVLLDLRNPHIVLKRSAKPFLEPVLPYEKNGFFGGVVFACGCLRDGGRLRIYYGAADDKVCRADADISGLLGAMG
jgi:predicted GH43/DUF377 family glycosyl hydrolase